MHYGDIAARFVAAVIDTIILAIVDYVLIIAMPFPFTLVICAFINWLYSVLLEGGEWHATLGKKIMGLYVTDADGYGISFSVAILRGIGKFFSGLLFGIGYLMAVFSPEKQALHDMLAKTYVLNEKEQAAFAKSKKSSPVKRFDYEASAREVNNADYNEMPELVCIKGPLAGMSYKLKSGGIAIGRDSVGCQVVLPSSQGKVSRVHCLITYNPMSGMFVLNDRNSTHGTYLANGTRVSYSQPAALKSGDRFYLASPENTFEVR